MMHIISQTRDERLAVYMKLTKRELAEMLVNCNEVMATDMNQVTFARHPQVSTTWAAVRAYPALAWTLEDERRRKTGRLRTRTPPAP